MESVNDWRKSTHSGGNGGECVEVGHAASTVAVRDSANRNGGTLTFSAAAWATFLTSVK